MAWIMPSFAASGGATGADLQRVGMQHTASIRISATMARVERLSYQHVLGSIGL